MITCLPTPRSNHLQLLPNIALLYGSEGSLFPENAKIGHLAAMNDRIRAFVPSHTQLGKSPLYREMDNTLHFVDVLGQTINILELSGSFKRGTIVCPERITFLSFHRDGGYLICSFSSIVRVSEEGEWLVQKQIFVDTTASRLNDAGVDSAGRLWVGSIDRIGE